MRLTHTVLTQMPSCLTLQMCKSPELAGGKAVLAEGWGRDPGVIPEALSDS